MSKTALITGSSNGIGYELAKIHAENGDDLVLVARNKCKLDELKRNLRSSMELRYILLKRIFPSRCCKEVYDEISRKIYRWIIWSIMQVLVISVFLPKATGISRRG